MYTLYMRSQDHADIRPGLEIAFRVDFAQTRILELELNENTGTKEG